MKLDHWGKKWTLTCFKAGGNGTKQFGGAFWGNSARLGLQLNFWVWELQIMRDF